MPAKKTNKKVLKKKAVKSKIPDFSIYEAINTPLIVFDAFKKRPLFANSAFEELSGYPIEKIKSMEFVQFFAKDDETRMQDLQDLLFTVSGELSEMDLTFRKRSGRKVSVNMFAKTMRSSKTQKNVVMAIHDISFIKKLQLEKESAVKEMNHVSKLADIGRLAAGVAHELNNPLMIIQGFAENIESLVEDEEIDFSELKWQLNPILKATSRMAKIISQLTRLSREDEEITLVVTNLAEVIEDVIQLIKNQINYNDIELVRDYDKEILVKCDPNQIEQIVLNIINNAVHALMNRHSSRKITVSIKKKSGMARLSISNNGPAIPSEIKDKILTPFFTTKEVGEGTGLGLSVSYGIMKAHGGDLTFKSDSKNGTSFMLHFPALTGQAEVQSTLTGVGIVVDDEELAREIISTKLMRFGFKVYQASNGQEALDIIEARNDIDFMFTDARMPVMDGATLIRNVRKFDRNMLIFAITGFTGIRGIEREFNKHGINGFLAKPLDHEKFNECIKQIEERLGHSKIKKVG